MVTDLNTFKNKAQTENTELAAQLEDAESKINSLTKVKNDLQAQLDEAKQELESENKVCMKCNGGVIWIYRCYSVGQIGCYFEAEAGWGRPS